MNKNDFTELIENIDFDFWCNAKRDIVLIVSRAKIISSVSEISRLIKRSYSVTYRHVADLEDVGVLRVKEGISLMTVDGMINDTMFTRK